MRGVPVNVNYRYLEDELVYLLDNSDAEALLFHGSLGDHVAKVARPRAAREALDPGRRRLAAPGVRGRLRRAASPRNEPMPRIERSGDDLYFLYTGGTTGMPKGVMWRAEDLCGVLGDGGVSARRADAARHDRPRSVRSRRRSSTRARTACTCPRRR